MQPPAAASAPLTAAHQSYRDAKITAMALAVVALVTLALTFLLWGLGTSPGMMLTGVNFIPYMVGTLFSAINVGVVIGVALFVLKMGYHRTQMRASNSNQIA